MIGVLRDPDGTSYKWRLLISDKALADCENVFRGRLQRVDLLLVAGDLDVGHAVELKHPTLTACLRNVRNSRNPSVGI